MSTSFAQFGFNSETGGNQDLNNFPSAETVNIVKRKMKKKRVVNGKVKIRLGKRKVVSLSPSALIGYIPGTKLKAAAKSVIRHQTSGLRGGGGGGKRKRGRKKGRKKTSRKKRKIASFV